jgi:hypothetical protein
MKKKSNAFKNKGQKGVTSVVKKVPPRRIVEYYYFPEGDVSARDIMNAAGEAYAEKADIWPDLNLCAIELEADSLIFQDAAECFIDPADQAWFEEKGILRKYQASWHGADEEAAIRILKNVLDTCGGRICSDTDDFEPSYGAEDVDRLVQEKQV